MKLINDEKGMTELDIIFPIAAVALIGALVVAGTNAAIDNLFYKEHFNDVSANLVTRSANTCGLDSRSEHLKQSITNDIWGIKNSYTWLPSKNAAEKLGPVDKNNITLFPISFYQQAFVWPDYTAGIIYNESGKTPVFAYRHLDEEKLAAITAQHDSAGNLPAGITILRKNSTGPGYTLAPATPAESATLSANPCFKPETEAGDGHKKVNEKIIAPAIKAGGKVLERILRPSGP